VCSSVVSFCPTRRAIPATRISRVRFFASQARRENLQIFFGVSIGENLSRIFPGESLKVAASRSKCPLGPVCPHLLKVGIHSFIHQNTFMLKLGSPNPPLVNDCDKRDISDGSKSIGN
jgi:hypothetical protein